MYNSIINEEIQKRWHYILLVMVSHQYRDMVHHNGPHTNSVAAALIWLGNSEIKELGYGAHRGFALYPGYPPMQIAGPMG